MWRALKYILLGVAAMALVAISHLYADETIVVQYGEWRAEPAIFVAAAAAAAAAIVLLLFFKLIFWMLFFPARMAAWKRARDDKNRRETLEDSVRALALDDYRRAFNGFSRLSRKSDPDGVFAWLAARSAKKSGDHAGRAEWLRRAAAHGGSDIAAAARAALAAEDGRAGEAFDILTEAGARNGSPLLAKMYLHIARRREKWREAMAAAYRLLDGADGDRETIAEIAAAALKTMQDGESLRDFWKNNVAAAEQKNPRLLVEYSYALHRAGDEKTRAETLERAVNIAPGSAAVVAAVAATGGDKLCETAFAAVQKHGGESDSDYLRAAATLAERLKLYGRARRYYQMANSLRPDPRNTAALDSLETRMRDAQDGAADA